MASGGLYISDNGKFREIFEKSPLGLIFHDKKGMPLNANESALEIMGISKFEDISDVNLFDNPFIEANKGKLLKEGIIRFQAPLNIENIKDFGLYYPNKNGFLYLDYIVSVTDHGFLVQIQDLTEFKESERNFEGLFNNKIMGVAYCKVIYNEDNEPVNYKFLKVNDAYETFTGLRKEDVIGKEVTEVIPGFEQSLIDLHNNVALTGEDLKYELYEPYLKRWYEINVYSPHYGFFISLFTDISKRKKTESKLSKNQEKFKLLSEAASLLLSSESPEDIISSICIKVMNHLDCHVFFNYLLDEKKQLLHLNAYSGIPEEIGESIEWLDLGVAVCGCVGRDGCPIVAEDIQNTSDERTELVKSFDIKAYACHPIILQGHTIGTLSFGTKSRNHFSDEDIELMRTITDYVATAMENKKTQENIQEALEQIQQFAEELEVSNEELQSTTEELMTANEELHATTEELQTANEELIKHEEKLRNERELLQAIIDTIPVMISIYDPQIEVLQINKEIEEVTGWTQEDMPNIDLMKELYPDDDYRSEVENYMQSLTPGWKEIIMRARDGSRIDSVWANVNISDGRNVGIGLDIRERKRAEKELDIQRQLLQTVVDHVPAAVNLIRGSDLRIILINPAYQAISPGKDIIGKTLNEVWPETQRDFVDLCRQVLATGKPYHSMDDLNMISRNPGEPPEPAYFTWWLFPIEIPGEGKGILNVALETTQRKKIEDKLKESYNIAEADRSRLNTLINTIPSAVVIIEQPDGEISFINERAKELYGIDPTGLKMEEHPKIGLLKLDGTPYPPEEMPASRSLLYGEVIHNEDLIIENPDGKLITVSASSAPIYNSEGEINAVIGVFDDITERKKLEDELRLARDNLEEQVEERTVELEEAYESLKVSEFNFKSLAENSPDIITRYNTDLRITYINRGSPVMNLPRDFFIGKTPVELGMDEENVKRWTEKLSNALDSGENQEMEYQFPGLEETRTFQSIITPEYNEKRQITSLLTITRDITKRKKAEEQLKETIKELERSNQELQSFAYITSHDLQEPLRTIASYAQLIQRRYEGKLDSDADEFINFMVSGATRMKSMIQGLLDYSRVGTRDGDFWKFSSQKALKHALSNLSSSIEECHAEITYGQLPVISGDEVQITQVFQNLIGNALKFRKRGIQPKIHISAQKTDKEYIFAVNDNGIGLEEQYTDKIFEVFKRLHAIGEYEGAGIGLAIVKRIIDRHGGRIWVESQLGEGSTFYFAIPIKSD